MLYSLILTIIVICIFGSDYITKIHNNVIDYLTEGFLNLIHNDDNKSNMNKYVVLLILTIILTIPIINKIINKLFSIH